jgi:hypothetical protein
VPGRLRRADTALSAWARDDLTVEVQIELGRSWIVADTYVDGAVERDGAYGLDIDFVADEDGAFSATPA